jgi:hypothetical protein
MPARKERTMRRPTSISVVLSILLLISIGSSAQQPVSTSVPNLIRYSGTLKEAQGTALLSSTTAGVTFSIYKQQEGGAPLWMETQNVTTDAGGNYSVLLGSSTSAGLPNDLFSQQEERWLGAQVQGQAEQPRVLMVSVPYAFKAHEADTLGGRSVSDFVLANGANSATNGIDVVPMSPLPVSNPASSGTEAAAPTQGPISFSGSTADQIVAVLQSGAGAGVNARAAGNAVAGTATGASGRGVFGMAAGEGGHGVVGESTNPAGVGTGVKGSSSSTSGTGVRGIEIATTGYTAGVSGYVASPSGTAAVFNNAAGGNIIRGQNNGVNKFSVDGSGNVDIAGAITGNGAGLTGLRFSQLGGFLGSAQFSGTYSSAVALSNTANVYYGDGSHLTGTGSGGGGNYIWNGTSQQPNANFNISGTGTADAFNSATNYQIRGLRVLGVDGGNVFLGMDAGYNTTGYNNVIIGYLAGTSNDTGFYNTFVGYEAGDGNTSGDHNTFVGNVVSRSNSTGSVNTFIGNDAGDGNTTGSVNTFLGSWAGAYNVTGNWDVYIANNGPSSGTESNAIRIGSPLTTNCLPQPQSPCGQGTAYIAGIFGATSSSGIPVYIDSDGKLGTQTSSLRFKEQVRDMGDSTDALMKLRPVTFLYKPEYANGERTLQYGLIAEEVATVYPELVAYDNDGQPYSVRYQYLTTMLLNEVQKQYHRAEAGAKVISQQEDKIEGQQRQIDSLQKLNGEFQQRLSRLEALVGAQVKIAEAPAP